MTAVLVISVIIIGFSLIYHIIYEKGDAGEAVVPSSNSTNDAAEKADDTEHRLAESKHNLEALGCVFPDYGLPKTEEMSYISNEYEYCSDDSFLRNKIEQHLGLSESCDDGLIRELEDGLDFEDYDNWDDGDWVDYVKRKKTLKKRIRFAYRGYY